MNIVNKLTIRHLKQNKRRTLVTIFGVIISVAMVTAVTTLGVSFMNLMQRETIAKEGEWHVLYKDVNKEQLKAIQKDDETESVIVSRDRGYARLEGGNNKDKPYLFLKEYSSTGFKQFPLELSKGRFPKSANEVVLAEHIATNGKVFYKLGEKISLNIGQRKVQGESNRAFGQQDSLQKVDGKVTERLENTTSFTYTVVGFIKRPTWEPTWAPGYTIVSYVDENKLSASDRVNASVVLKKVKGSLYDHANELAKSNNMTEPQFHDKLLRYYGVTIVDGLHRMLYSLMAIIMTVIIIGSVSLIYNAFAISVSERSRHLGMLASVGATKRQKRNSVFFEGIIIGLISIPLGILAGIGGIAVTFLAINSALQGALGVSEPLTVTVTPLSIISACVISMVTILISTYVPAIKASRISAIDAIRQTTEVKLTGKTVKTSKLVRKLFGIEAEFGLKNLKRNKRKYQATVFSLVISIVLFLTVSYFTDNLRKSAQLSQDHVNFDLMVSKSNATKSDRQLMTSFSTLDDVTEANMVRGLYMSSWVAAASLPEKLQAEVKKDRSVLQNGKYPYSVRIDALSEKDLQAYAKTAGVDDRQLSNSNQLTAIVINTINYQEADTGKYVETKAIEMNTGEMLELFYRDEDSGNETLQGKLEIIGLAKQIPTGVFAEGLGGVNLIVSEQTMNKLLKKELSQDVQTSIFLKSKDPLKTQQEIEEVKEDDMNIWNVYQSRQQSEQLILLMSVFTYGFIALITAISIANIVNTISTSISLRKREFAMLKSVGMTPRGFNKMIQYESMFYGIKALVYGLPLSIGIMYLIYRAMMNSFSYDFSLPWISMMIVVAAVFTITGTTMLYSSAKVKKENIIDVLKQENI
ncbi:ABC transporter permease [Bacillus rubiinfantis]|uniref:ABC transporter permease n=1 Tax=Bacillus rubiinfantis TaxID=1499680 RepID=UPI0005A7C569|nr:ABC transporter permease [Bacillus rubiinfantis]